MCCYDSHRVALASFSLSGISRKFKYLYIFLKSGQFSCMRSACGKFSVRSEIWLCPCTTGLVVSSNNFCKLSERSGSASAPNTSGTLAYSKVTSIVHRFPPSLFASPSPWVQEVI